MLNQDRNTKFKKLVRSGIPGTKRHYIWPKILDLSKLSSFEKNYEQNLYLLDLDAAGRPKSEKYATFGGGLLDKKKFALTGKGMQVAKNLLNIISKIFPAVEACPMLPTLVALFLHYLSPSQTLGCISVMLKRTIQERDWYYLPIEVADMTVLYSALSNLTENMPKLSAHIKMIDSRTPCCIRWINNFLLDTMTLDVSFRLLDSFIVEGYKVLIRYALAILRLRGPDILRCQKSEHLDAMFALHPFGNNPEDSSELSRIAQSFSFSRQDIKKLKDKALDLSDYELTNEILDEQNPPDTPKVLSKSSFVEYSHWEHLWTMIPERFRGLSVQLLFSTQKHGYRLQTLYNMCSEASPQIIFVQSTSMETIGAYLSDPWKSKSAPNRFFGSAETFLFTLEPAAKKFSWSGIDQKTLESPKMDQDSSLFIMADSTLMAVGGGGLHFGLSLDSNLSIGTTGTCNTFQNPPLISSSPGKTSTQFNVRNIEVWGFNTGL